MGSIVSAVGVVDKAMVLVDAVEARPRSLSELVEASGFSRATTHRLAGSLEQHGLLRRDREGRYTLGARFISLGQNAEAGFPLAEVAVPILQRLVDQTGESAQLMCDRARPASASPRSNRPTACGPSSNAVPSCRYLLVRAAKLFGVTSTTRRGGPTASQNERPA